MRDAALLVVIAAAAGACVRDPAEAECPALSPGGLVLTELRGPQEPEDMWGSWIELFNASGRAIDLAGIQIRFRSKDGGDEIPLLVRRSLVAPAGTYIVLGLFDDADPPAHVDYGFRGDFRGRWPAAADIDVEACGTRVDHAVYDELPGQGTRSLNGSPDATRNDSDGSWCPDATQVGAMFPGTPRSRNITCP